MATWLKGHLSETLFVNAYVLIFMRVFGAGTGFLFWLLAARFATPEAIGLASGAVSAVTLLAGLAQLGLGYSLVRHLPSSPDRNGLLSLAWALCGGSGLMLAALFLAGLPVWSPGLLILRADGASTLFFVIFVVSTSLSQLQHWVFLSARRLSYSMWKMVLQSLVAIVLLIGFRPLMGGYAATVAAYLVSVVFGLGLGFWPFLRQAQPDYRFSWSFVRSFRSSFAGYALASHASDQLQRLPDTLLPLIVIGQLGPAAGAYFFVVWTLGRSLASWAGSIADALFAEGANEPGLASAYLRRSVKGGLVLVLGMALIALLLGRWILSLFGRQYVENGTGLLCLVTLASIPTVVVYILVTYLRLKDQLVVVLGVMTLNAIGGLVCAAIGMAWIGLLGAGIGWLISQVVVLSGLLVWWQWQVPRQPQRTLGQSAKALP